MCCAIAAMLLALFPAWNGGREAALAWLASFRNVALGGAGLLTLASSTALAASAYPHQAAHICSVLTGF